MALVSNFGMGPGNTDLVPPNSENDTLSGSPSDQLSEAFDDDIDLSRIFDEDRQMTLNQMDTGTLSGKRSSKTDGSWPQPASPEDPKDAWQNDSSDMPHRREVIRLVAELLKQRKSNPTAKWMKELPYKARKLEEQLYKTAPSLEAYVDKKTLKHRLKRVAKAITTQFRVAKRGSSKSCRASSSSTRSSSVTSTGSSRSSMASIGSVSIDGSVGPASLSATGNPPLPTVSTTAPVSSLSDQPPDSLDDLQKKQALNQKLQQEILENIRQQQQIMRDLLNQQQQPPSTNMFDGKKKDDTSSSSMTSSTSTMPFNKSSMKQPASQAASSLPTPMKPTGSFNHKELMAAAQSGLQSAILNNTNTLQRRISAPSPQQLMVAQQALVNNAGMSNNLPNNMGGMQRSNSAPPMSHAMMAAAAAAMQGNNNNNTNMGMVTPDNAAMMAASLGGGGARAMNPAAGGMNMNNNINFMAGTMMQQQQQAALLQQQQQQLQQQLAAQQQKNNMQLPDTGFHPTMPPPKNLMTSSMRSSITGPSQQQLNMSPNNAAMRRGSRPDDSFDLSPSTFNW